VSTASTTPCLRHRPRVLLHGRARPGRLAADDNRSCARRATRATGLVPTIEAADPHHLVFIEPDIYSIHGKPNLLGPMTFPRLVFNVHFLLRVALTGDRGPDKCGRLLGPDPRVAPAALAGRPQLTSRAQPGGPAWFLSEFGASSDPNLLEQGGPTPPTSYSSAGPTGRGSTTTTRREAPTRRWHRRPGPLAPTATVLSRTYPQAIDGVPSAYSFDPGSGAFSLTYQRPATSSAPTSSSWRDALPERLLRHRRRRHLRLAAGAAHLVVDNATGSGTVQ